MKLFRPLLGVLALALSTVPAQAAVITWGAATGITGDSNVSTNGSLVGAFNIGGAGVGNTTVNGVTFTGLALSGNNVTSGNFNFSTAGTLVSNNATGSASPPFNTLSASYQTLLSSIAGTVGSPPASVTLTISGLVVGQSYEFEWWNSASNNSPSSTTTATAGNAVSLLRTGSPGSLGQFAIGTFTADATTQVIVFSSTNEAALNGFQLRQVNATADVVPEPATLAVFGLMAVGAAGWRRRVRA